MNLNDHIKILSEMEANDRNTYIDHLEIKNYGSSELTETDMWILSQAAENNEYLTGKLKEAEELSLDTEAPEEEVTIEPELDLGTDTSTEDELSLDTPSDDTELSLDTPAEDELSLDTPTDTPAEDELSLDTPTDTPSEEPKEEIETSKAGIGILALLGEIQEKLATGKPSEVELAALKALKKLVG